MECWKLQCHVGLLERGGSVILTVRSRLWAETFMEVRLQESIIGHSIRCIWSCCSWPTLKSSCVDHNDNNAVAGQYFKYKNAQTGWETLTWSYNLCCYTALCWKPFTLKSGLPYSTLQMALFNSTHKNITIKRGWKHFRMLVFSKIQLIHFYLCLSTEALREEAVCPGVLGSVQRAQDALFYSSQIQTIRIPKRNFALFFQ